MSEDSEIIATSWQPTFFEGSAQVEFESDVINLGVTGENLGWKAHHLEVRASVRHPADTSLVGRTYTWDHYSLAPRSSFEFRETIPNPNKDGTPPTAIELELDWGSGRKLFRPWPPGADPPPPPPLLERAAFRSVGGVMAAVVVLWIGIPALVGVVRRDRRE